MISYGFAIELSNELKKWTTVNRTYHVTIQHIFIDSVLMIVYKRDVTIIHTKGNLKV